jgi:hypothetical protein
MSKSIQPNHFGNFRVLEKMRIGHPEKLNCENKESNMKHQKRSTNLVKKFKNSEKLL